MHWSDRLHERLAQAGAVGYRLGGKPASEPTALATLAHIATGNVAAANAPLTWLRDVQAADGGVGLNAQQPTPAWTTPLAVLAWVASQRAAANAERQARRPLALREEIAPVSRGDAALEPTLAYVPLRPQWSVEIRRGIDWLLATEGTKLPPRGEGHDSQLIGWPWVCDTHSWVEPTALAVLTLKATGYGSHPRTREAVRLLIDRLLPDGGCNYGNTVVLGQQLVPHIQPTGLALLALAGERDPSGRIERSVNYLAQVLDDETAPASLSYGLLGMAAHGTGCCMAEEWLAVAAQRAEQHQSPLEMALVLLAGHEGDAVIRNK